MDAETALRAVIAAWDEPHYGDKDTQLNNVYDAVEKARAVLATIEKPAEAAPTRKLTQDQKEAAKKRIYWPMRTLLLVGQAKLKVMHALNAACENKMDDALKHLVEANNELREGFRYPVHKFAASMTPDAGAPQGDMAVQMFVRKRTGLPFKQ